jgi:penicillin-binding protein 1A
MNGMYAPTGGNIDGGTYPADIWGAYMREAKGSFCGSFAPPKEPFQSSPFYGKHSRANPEGSKTDSTGDATGTTPTEPTTPTTTPTAPPEQGTGGEGFDPNTYESPPQGSPDTGGGTGGASPG